MLLAIIIIRKQAEGSVKVGTTRYTLPQFPFEFETCRDYATSDLYQKTATQIKASAVEVLAKCIEG
jgi:hypothetical protein